MDKEWQVTANPKPLKLKLKSLPLTFKVIILVGVCQCFEHVLPSDAFLATRRSHQVL